MIEIMTNEFLSVLATPILLNTTLWSSDGGGRGFVKTCRLPWLPHHNI